MIKFGIFNLKFVCSLIFLYIEHSEIADNRHVCSFQAQTAASAITAISSSVVPKPPSAPATVVMEPLPLWQLASSAGYYVKLAGIMGASAVALGAYGAHCKISSLGLLPNYGIYMLSTL